MRSSGEFVDPDWHQGGDDEPRKVTTDFSFQGYMLWRLKDTKAAVGIFMDCPYSGMTAPPGNFSLLAACDRYGRGVEGETSLCANVISILREAYETKKYVTFGGIHSNIMTRARIPNTVATMPIW